MKLKFVPLGITAPTIDDLRPSDTPSLIGFWKCFDAANGVIPDHSGYGNDLTIIFGYNEFSFQSVQEMLDFEPGYLSTKLLDGALTTATGTLLDTQNRVIFATAELRYPVTLGTIPGYGLAQQDIDFGTSHDIGAVHDVYQGFMLGGAVGRNYFRVSHYNGAIFNQFYYATDGGVAVAVDTPFAIAGAFIPGTALYSSVNQQAVQTITTALTSGNPISSATSLVAQDGKFGWLSGPQPTSVRNYQLWSWPAASAPTAAQLAMTVEWCTYNPGKIPPWLIGK